MAIFTSRCVFATAYWMVLAFFKKVPAILPGLVFY